MELAIRRRDGNRAPGRARVVARGMLGAGLVLLLALAFVVGVLVRERVAAPAVPAERPRPALTTGARIEALQQRLTRDGNDAGAAVELAAAYLQQTRETGDPSFYGRAEALLAGVLERDPANAGAMAWMGALDLARHDFTGALDWGRRARALQPDLLAAFPVLIDASVELGRYDDAVRLSDAFVGLRPDLASYTRVSYLRELHGDRVGAIQALELALDTVPEGSEPHAWTRVQLANLYRTQGDLATARREYERTLAGYPEYAPALAGLARVTAAEGDLAAAIALAERAAVIPLAEYVILLGDLQSAAGNATEAARQYALVDVLMQLQQANGVTVDLELALFAADHPQALGKTPDDVAALARVALAERPSIHGHDTLAWALYRAGDAEAAWREMEQALRLGTDDALLHFHAGMIARARGDDAVAARHLERALALDPHFSILHAPEAHAALAALTGR